MSQNNAIKNAGRARQALTGESYTEAHAAVVAEHDSVDPADYRLTSRMLRWLRLPGKLVWRFFTGKHLDGQLRTDAGWFTEGRRRLPPESRPQPPDSVTGEICQDIHAFRTEWRELRARRR